MKINIFNILYNIFDGNLILYGEFKGFNSISELNKSLQLEEIFNETRIFNLNQGDLSIKIDFDTKTENVLFNYEYTDNLYPKTYFGFVYISPEENTLCDFYLEFRYFDFSKKNKLKAIVENLKKKQKAEFYILEKESVVYIQSLSIPKEEKEVFLEKMNQVFLKEYNLKLAMLLHDPHYK